MSNDTQIAEHMELVDRYAVCEFDGSNASSEELRAAIEASARQLSEQPGFVMVPVEVVKFLTGEGPLDGLWFGEHPFGLGGGKYWWRNHLPAARPLTASPTAPSTEASEPVRDERAPCIHDWEDECRENGWRETCRKCGLKQCGSGQ